MSGFGEMIYNSTGHRYVGHWANNKKEGDGTFWYTDGNIYTGAFKDDVKHGFGKLLYRPGTLVEESYEGMFDRGVRHGHGKYIYKAQSGITYEGCWHRGLRHGKGMLRWARRAVLPRQLRARAANGARAHGLARRFPVRV